MYNLYLDKSENFECEVAVKNASMKDAFARMIVETGGSSGSVSINANEIAQAVWQYSVTGSMPASTYGDQVYRKLLTLAQYMATK